MQEVQKYMRFPSIFNALRPFTHFEVRQPGEVLHERFAGVGSDDLFDLLPIGRHLLDEPVRVERVAHELLDVVGRRRLDGLVLRQVAAGKSAGNNLHMMDHLPLILSSNEQFRRGPRTTESRDLCQYCRRSLFSHGFISGTTYL